MNAEDLFELQQHGDVTVIRFTESRILDSGVIQQLGDSLFRIVDEEGASKLVVNLAEVSFLSSAALNRLILLKKKVSILIVFRRHGRILKNPVPSYKRCIHCVALTIYEI